VPERRKAATESGGVCKHCQKGTYKDAEGKLHHDGRAAEPPPESGSGEGEGQGDKKPKRDHALHRRIGG
jgi:hypothetical protein